MLQFALQAASVCWVLFFFFLQFDFLNSNINLSGGILETKEMRARPMAAKEVRGIRGRDETHNMMKNGTDKKKVFECVKKYGKLNNRNHMIVYSLYRSQNETITNTCEMKTALHGIRQPLQRPNTNTDTDTHTKNRRNLYSVGKSQ